MFHTLRFSFPGKVSNINICSSPSFLHTVFTCSRKQEQHLALKHASLHQHQCAAGSRPGPNSSLEGHMLSYLRDGRTKKSSPTGHMLSYLRDGRTKNPALKVKCSAT